jgi:hypothetical protein
MAPFVRGLLTLYIMPSIGKSTVGGPGRRAAGVGGRLGGQIMGGAVGRAGLSLTDAH